MDIKLNEIRWLGKGSVWFIKTFMDSILQLAFLQSPGLGGYITTEFHGKIPHQVLHLFSKLCTDCSQLAASNLADCWFSHLFSARSAP